MGYESFDFLPGVSQKALARPSPWGSFTEQFLDGRLSLAAGFRDKADGDLFRVWCANRPQPAARSHTHELVVEIADENCQAGDVRALVATMTFENAEGMQKGKLGRRIFWNLFDQNQSHAAHPFWWASGVVAVDESVKLKQLAQYGGDKSLALSNDLYRYAASEDQVTAVRELGWRVEPGGLVLDILDNERFECLEVLAGPLTWMLHGEDAVEAWKRTR